MGTAEYCQLFLLGAQQWELGYALGLASHDDHPVDHDDEASSDHTGITPVSATTTTAPKLCGQHPRGRGTNG
jgi:hypothetical protein